MGLLGILPAQGKIHSSDSSAPQIRWQWWEKFGISFVWTAVEKRSIWHQRRSGLAVESQHLLLLKWLLFPGFCRWMMTVQPQMLFWWVNTQHEAGENRFPLWWHSHTSYASCQCQNLRRWTHWRCLGSRGKHGWGYQQSEWKAVTACLTVSCVMGWTLICVCLQVKRAEIRGCLPLLLSSGTLCNCHMLIFRQILLAFLPNDD